MLSRSDTVGQERRATVRRLNRHAGSRLLCLCLSLLGGMGAARGEIELGPLFHEFNLTLAPGRRQEFAGPLFYYEQNGHTRTWAIPPLLSYTLNTDTDFSEFDLLYPVLGYDRFGEQYRWHLMQVINWAGGPSQTDTNTHRFNLFPFYLSQRSDDPAKNYTAVFPFYGRTQNRFFRTEVDWVMWPLFVKTVRRTKSSQIARDPFDAPTSRFLSQRRGDIATWNYVYPLFHRREGPGLTGWQFWPIVGHEHKEVTRPTNQWHDVETVPGHDKFFTLLYFNHHTDIGTDNPVHQRMLLPFFSSMRSPLRDSVTAPWPLGYTYTDDRARKYREWAAPWPLIVFARGEGKTTSRVWPFFSQSHNDALESDWYLWPLYKFNRLHSDPLDRTRHRILLFLYSDAIERNTESGQYKRRLDFLPFYAFRRDFDGSERRQVLTILEPILANNKSIERNWSHVWTLWRAEKNAKTGATSQSLLWNLWRRETTPQTRKCSLLFGLFQYESGPEGAHGRVFYVPFGPAKKTADAPAP